MDGLPAGQGLLLLVGATAAIGVTFGHLIYMGWERHYGILFLAFLVALWVQRRTLPAIPTGAYVLLCLSALGGLQAAYGEWDHPFSNSAGMARWIRAHGLQDEPMVVAYTVETVEELERPAYMVECNCIDTFLLFSDRRDHFDWRDLPGRIEEGMDTLGAQRALFLSALPLSPDEMAQLHAGAVRATLLAAFGHSETEANEAHYLYQLSRF